MLNNNTVPKKFDSFSFMFISIFLILGIFLTTMILMNTYKNAPPPPTTTSSNQKDAVPSTSVFYVRAR